MARYLVAAVIIATGFSSAVAQNTPTIPNFWDPQERFIKPNTKNLPRLKFLTTTDFPPFSFIADGDRLAGFHVDLARAICEELEVLSVCQIQALPFDELIQAVTSGKGDAILAGLSITAATRQELTFSRSYFQLPGRFLALTRSKLPEPLARSLAGKKVGIIEGTAQAAYARANFGDLHLRLFETADAALATLQKNEIRAVFSDGLSLAFWLQAEQKRAAQNKIKPCCYFVGGPYISREYFGEGLAVAMAKGNLELENAINFALRSLNDKGRFAEIYLRYFPIGLF